MKTDKGRLIISAEMIAKFSLDNGIGLVESAKTMRKHNLMLDAEEAESFQALKRVVIELARAL